MAFIPDPSSGQLIQVTDAEYRNWLVAQSMASAGEVQLGEQDARAQGTTSQTPQPPVQQLDLNAFNLTSGSDATQNIIINDNLVTTPNIFENVQYNTENSYQNVEYGTDGRYRPLTQTQAISPTPDLLSFNVFGNDNGNALPPTPSLDAGVGARGDDNTAPNTNAVQQIVNANFNQQITSEANVLDQYASYTYSISWYLITPTQYNTMLTTQKKSVAGWKLLIQSGGIPVNSRFTASYENPIFSMDYYLDNLEIDSVLSMKGTGSATNATDIKFTVTEPNGITLLNNIYNAVLKLYRTNNVSKDVNYTQAHYVLAVRFYGYDDNGNLAQVGRNASNTINTTDPRAVVEKFYPFNITNITFKIANKAVEYQVTGKPIPYVANKSQDRGTIPYAFELSGTTVGDVLVGKSQRATAASIQEGRPTAPIPSTPGYVNQADQVEGVAEGVFNDGWGEG
jgi:hypothetical protein